MANSFSVISAATAARQAQLSEAPGAAAEAAPDRLTLKTKIAYAMGGTTDIFGHWFYNNMKDPVYNVFLGLSPSQFP